MSRSTDPGFKALTSSLSPSAVSRYLALHGWEFEAGNDGIKEIWRLPGQPSERPRGRILLPLDQGFVDFQQRFYDALLAIGLLNDWDAAQVYEQIVATRADRFQLRP